MRTYEAELIRMDERRDNKARVEDELNAIHEDADELGADLATLEIVRLRLSICFEDADDPEPDDETL